jgi:hypothetical protein
VNYDQIFDEAISRLHEEGRYRVFIDILRNKGAFPNARCFAGHNGPKPVTVWCSNDYLAMGQHPKVISAMEEALHDVGAGSVECIPFLARVKPYRGDNIRARALGPRRQFAQSAPIRVAGKNTARVRHFRSQPQRFAASARTKVDHRRPGTGRTGLHDVLATAILYFDKTLQIFRPTSDIVRSVGKGVGQVANRVAKVQQIVPPRLEAIHPEIQRCAFKKRGIGSFAQPFEEPARRQPRLGTRLVGGQGSGGMAFTAKMILKVGPGTQHSRATGNGHLAQ